MRGQARSGSVGVTWLMGTPFIYLYFAGIEPVIILASLETPPTSNLINRVHVQTVRSTFTDPVC